MEYEINVVQKENCCEAIPPTVCDYCGSPVVFGSNAEIYGKEYGNGLCSNILGIPPDACHFGWFDRDTLHHTQVIRTFFR